MNGAPIQNYPLPKASMTIYYSIEFEEHLARIFAGLGPNEYEALPGTPDWCDELHPLSKCEVIALYRNHRLMIAVREHAAAKGKGRR